LRIVLLAMDRLAPAFEFLVGFGAFTWRKDALVEPIPLDRAMYTNGVSLQAPGFRAGQLTAANALGDTLLLVDLPAGGGGRTRAQDEGESANRQGAQYLVHGLSPCSPKHRSDKKVAGNARFGKPAKAD
jgi:hypothetical protein